MYWYKLHAIHGGGHQQETTDYHWSEYKLTEDEEKEHLIEWCSQFRNFKGEIESIECPPREALQKILNDAELRLASAEHHVNTMRKELAVAGIKFAKEIPL
jgi:hypothetical protein